MSGIYPVFDPPMLSADSFNGKGLSADLERLDEIAASLNLPLLSQFIDAHAMMREVLDEEDIPVDCPPERWYPAQEGLATVGGLLLYVEQQPEQLCHESATIMDLEHLASLLDEAERLNVRFQLLVDL